MTDEQMQSKITKVMDRLKPHTETLLRTMLENRPKEVELLMSRNSLETFLLSCEQMIYQRCWTTRQQLLKANPLPKLTEGELPSVLAMNNHHLHIEMMAEEMVLHPLLDMNLTDLEAEMLTVGVAEEAMTR